MRKGDLVQFNPTLYPKDGLRESIPSRRPITPEEVAAWYESPASQGMTSSGESKLPPRAVYVEIPVGTIMIVERARCRVQLGYGNPTPGMTKVLLPTGESTYVARELLSVV